MTNLTSVSALEAPKTMKSEVTNSQDSTKQATSQDNKKFQKTGSTVKYG